MLDIEWNEWGTDKSLPSLDRFVAAGGDVNTIDAESGKNLLWLAAEQMDISLIQRLGELGADPNRQLLKNNATTAVHNAADIDIDSVLQCRQPANSLELTQLVTFAVFQAMVAIGGSIHIADGSGKTPYDIACDYHPDLGSKLRAIVDG